MFTLGIEVPLRDGTVLRGLHYSPDSSDGPAPVIVCFIPYGADQYHAEGFRFAERGFHFVCLDSRGRGDSDGVFTPFVFDGADGHDAVQWLGSQNWCDGSVVTWGGSYCGFVQWATAATYPSHLRAIAPAASVYPGIDFPMVRNVPTQYAVQWLTLVAGRRMNNKPFGDDEMWRAASRRLISDKLPFRDLDLISVGRRLAVFQEWLDHPSYDAYWQGFAPERYDAIDVPVLTITGQYDDDQLGALRYHDEHIAAVGPERHHVVIGPWDHGGTRSSALSFGGLTFAEESRVDLPGLHADWYDWVLGRGERPSFLADRVVYFHVGEDRWRSAPGLPSAGGSLELSPSSGQLALDPRQAGDADREIPAEDAYFVDRTAIRVGAVFRTEPFAEPVDLSGRPQVTLSLSTEVADFDLMISLHLLRGSEVLWLGETLVRARYRSSLQDVSAWPAGEPVEVAPTGLPFISRRLEPGDRIALALRPPHRGWQPNFQNGGSTADETPSDAQSGVLQIHDVQVSFP